MTPASTPQIREYLLGKLRPEEEAHLEWNYFTDPAYLDELWAVFAELSEQYLRNELLPSERAQFETKLQSSPALREMFENEKALFEHARAAISETAQAGALPVSVFSSFHSGFFRRLRGLSFRLALLGAVLVLAISIYTIRPSKKNPPINSEPATAIRHEKTPETPMPSASVSPSPPELARTPHRSQAVVATFFLPVQAWRSNTGFPVLTLPRHAQTLRLELQLMNGHSLRYSAILQTESSNPLHKWESLSPQRSALFDKIVLHVPTKWLNESDYTVKLIPLDNADSGIFTQQFRFTIAHL